MGPHPSTTSPLIPRIFMLQRKSIENRTNFDRELLGSQATYDIDFILFGILTTISFLGVVYEPSNSRSKLVRFSKKNIDFLCNISILGFSRYIYLVIRFKLLSYTTVYCTLYTCTPVCVQCMYSMYSTVQYKCFACLGSPSCLMMK